MWNHPKRGLVASVAVFALAIAAAGLFGFLLLNLTIVPYDDEGYMLATVQGLKDGGALYDGVYSQYGPFFGLTWLAVSEIVPGFLSHDGTRIVVLLLWLGSSLLLAASVFRLSRNTLFSVVTFLAAFQVLRCLIGEPLHPLSLIALLLSLMVFVGTFYAPDRASRVSALLGALIAGLLLVKVNLGLLAAAALVVAVILLNGSRERGWRAAALGLLALAIFSPLALMAFDLDQPWVRNFGLVVVMSLLAIVVTAYPHSSSGGQSAAPTNRFPLVPAAIAGLATVTLTFLITLALGTSPGGLIDGIILEPLALRETFSLPFFTPGLAVVASAFFLVAAALLRLAPEPPLAVIQTARALGGAAVIWCVIEPTSTGRIEPTLHGLTLALPLVWVALIRTRDDESRNRPPASDFAVLFLALLAVYCALHLYPVAGNQVGVSSFLLVPAGAIALWRAWSTSGAGRVAGRSAIGMLSVLLGFAIVVQISIKDFVQEAPALASQYRDNPALDLDGAGLVHPAPSSAAELEAVTHSLQRNCDTFYSIPGLNRFYFLSGLPLASGLNATSWPWLFDYGQQRQVVEDLQSQSGKRICILTNESILESNWGVGEPKASGPLVDYLSRNRRLIDSIGPYEIFLKLDGKSPGPDLNR